MVPKPKHPHSGELFKQALEEMIEFNHSLAKLPWLIDWGLFERECSARFVSSRCRPVRHDLQEAAASFCLVHGVPVQDHA
jgi:IS5 family transposase